MNTRVRVSLWTVFIFFGNILSGGIAGMVVLFLVFWGTSTLFSTVAARIYICASRVLRFPSIHPHQHFLFVDFFMIDSHFNRYEVISHCGFDLHYSDDEQHWTSFHVFVGLLFVFSRIMSTQIFCPFLNWIVWSVFILTMWDV